MKSKFTFLLLLGFISTFLFSTLNAQEVAPFKSKSQNTLKTNLVRTESNPHTYNFGPRGTVFFEEGFESGSLETNEWVITDADGDGYNWFAVSSTDRSHSGSYFAGSYSWYNVALTPDDWMASKAIDLTNASGTVILEYWTRAQDQTWPNEFYGVYASTSGNSVADFTGENGEELFSETLQKGTDEDNNLYVKRTIDLTNYIGNTVYIAFRHYNCTDWFLINIDDISVYESSTVDVGITGVVAPSNTNSCGLSETEDVAITLFNYGGVAETNFPVSYTFNGVTVVDTFKETLLPAASASFTFSQPATFSELGYYNFDFNVNVEGDVDSDNNDYSYSVANTDANIKVVVSSDSDSGQSWEIVSSDGTVIATHDQYQWNITETTKVCVLNDDCYNFYWYGGTENTVSVYYNDVLIKTTDATGDFTVYSLGGACQPVDAIYLAQFLPEYGIVGSQYLAGQFMNIGSETITSFNVQYVVNNDSSVVEPFTNVNIAPGDTFTFVHNTPYNFSAVGKYAVELTISDFNGEFTPVINTLYQTYYVLSYQPTVRVLGEEATGTWCGWCVRGHVFMEYMDETYPNSWVGVAVHNSDPMTVTAYDNGIGNYIGGYPSGLINRYQFAEGYDVDPYYFEDAYNIFKDEIVPAGIEITSATYNDTIDVVKFTGKLLSQELSIKITIYLV
ncbi:MAG: choice-of-anchor J domain-containing protein [Saprospiraceae bacterium]